ncbi:MAG: hypothetical protein ACUVQ8_06050 [Nitrososphaeria archaeon]
MGWRGGFRKGYGMWPGRGPFSYLPPWQRPGWFFGRGACWWLFPYLHMYGYPYPSVPLAPHTQYVPPIPYPYYWR